MLLSGESGYIRCCFSPGHRDEDDTALLKIDLFFARNEDLLPVFKECLPLISEKEMKRAEKFISADTRETYILAHATLRKCLSKYIDTKPEEILFETTENSKPYVAGNPVYFNISHTNKAFVIAIATGNYVGADIEEIIGKSDVRSIAMNFFSSEEQNFIFSAETEIDERFFLLWTRKESFLKAIGTGIVNRLDKVVVSEDVNFIDRGIFEDLLTGELSSEHYIYSFKESDYYISVTAPCKADISFHLLKPADFKKT